MATIYDRGLFAAPSSTSAFANITTTTRVGGGAGDVQALNAAINPVKVHSATIVPNHTVVQRPVVKGSMGNIDHLMGKSTAQVDLVFELKVANLTTAPEYADILKACGIAMTGGIVAATNVTFAPDNTGSTVSTGSLVDICIVQDGKYWRADNCAGTATIDFTMGNMILVTATLQGQYIDPLAITGAALTAMTADLFALTYDAGVPIIAASPASVITEAGGAVAVAAMSFDLGNDVQEHYTSASHTFVVANRAPKITFTKDTVASVTDWTNLVGATSVVINGQFSRTATSVAGTGAILTLNAGHAVADSVAYNTRAERDLLDIAFSLYESGTADSQWSLAFT